MNSDRGERNKWDGWKGIGFSGYVLNTVIMERRSWEYQCGSYRFKLRFWEVGWWTYRERLERSFELICFSISNCLSSSFSFFICTALYGICLSLWLLFCITWAGGYFKLLHFWISYGFFVFSFSLSSSFRHNCTSRYYYSLSMVDPSKTFHHFIR